MIDRLILLYEVGFYTETVQLGSRQPFNNVDAVLSSIVITSPPELGQVQSETCELTSLVFV